MGHIEDIVKLLERIPLWKRLANLPDKVAELEKRLIEVENLLNGKAPPEICEKCGER